MKNHPQQKWYCCHQDDGVVVSEGNRAVYEEIVQLLIQQIFDQILILTKTYSKL